VPFESCADDFVLGCILTLPIGKVKV